MSGLDDGSQQIDHQGFDHQALPCLTCIPWASGQTVKALKNNMLHFTYLLEIHTFPLEPKKVSLR